MTGFIRGLFSKFKSDEAKAPVERPKQEKADRPKKEKVERLKRENPAFFLDSTDAQTFGNSEYMRASKKTRRTFPKSADGSGEQEYIQELSAMGRVTPGKAKVDIVAPQTETQSTPTVDVAAQRRKAASDMDMFRKMAKDIRK